MNKSVMYMHEKERAPNDDLQQAKAFKNSFEILNLPNPQDKGQSK